MLASSCPLPLSVARSLPYFNNNLQVLIPGGPMQPPTGGPPMIVAAPPQPDPTLNGGVLAPPSVVVPQLSGHLPPNPSMPLNLPMPPTVVPPAGNLPPLPFPPTQYFPPSTSTAPMPMEMIPVAAPPAVEDASPAGFNINNLLAQLAGSSAQTYEESPASPPMHSEPVADVRHLIPSSTTISWRLVPVDVPHPPYLDVSSQLINVSASLYR